MRAFFLQLSRQLVIKKQSVVQPGFGVLRGKGADQRIDPATLFARFRQIRQQAIKRTADVRRPFAHIALHHTLSFAVKNAPRTAFQPILSLGLLTQPAQAEQQNHHHHDDRQRDDAGGLQRAHIAGEGIDIGDVKRTARVLQQRSGDLTVAVQRIPGQLQSRQFIGEEIGAAAIDADGHDTERTHHQRQPLLLFVRGAMQH
ncbi:hypothetical protein D3C79_620320 [compost metagenome]